MRLFLAIDIPDPIRRLIGGVQEQLRKSIRGPIRWVDPANFHFTIKFLGEVEDASPILAAVQSIQGSCFDLQLGSLAQLPPTDRADVVMIDLANVPDELLHLHQAVEAAFESLNFPRDPRPFHPHLTLARLSVPRFVSREIALDIAPVRFHVDAIHLMESTHDEAGSTYRKISRIDLSIG